MKSFGCIIGLGAIIIFLAWLAAIFNDEINYIWLGGLGLVLCFLLLTMSEK